MQQRAANTREAILKGAATVFIARGFSGTSLSDVMAAAQVTKGALYFHFQSKEELALAVITAQHAASTAVGADLFVPSIPGLRAFITLTARYALQMLADPLVRAGIRLTMEAASYTEPIIDPYLDWIKAGEMLLARAQVAGEISADVDVKKVAHFIVPTFTGIQLLSDVLTSHEDLYQRVREMWELVIPALVQPDEIEPWRESVRVIMNEVSAESGVEGAGGCGLT
jgi:AcrR family transcriptional regulator